MKKNCGKCCKKCFQIFLSYFLSYKSLKNHFETTRKLYVIFFFCFFQICFSRHYKDGTIETKSVQKINLNRILGVEKTILQLEKK